MQRPTPLLLLAGASLALAACASDEGAYPSLGKRPAERITATWPPPPPAPPPPSAPLDPAVAARLGELVATAQGADATFQRRVARTRSVVGTARGAAMGSESWSVATIAVAELESARAQAMVAMAELDSLYAEARTTGRDVAPITAARDQVTALIAGEDATLDSLKGALAR